jgi:hypothetical protein
MRRAKSNVPNRGGGEARRTEPQDRAAYVLEGALRYVDRDGTLAALLVQDGNAAGRRLVGRTLTLDLRDAQIAAPDRNADGMSSREDLVVGDRVSVRARLPRRLLALPDVLPVRRLAAWDPAPAS